jgi:RimJ/RimL family protein N-acetyltransferase
MNPILLDVPQQIETARLIVRCPRPGDGEVVHEGVVESLAELRAWPASLPWAISEPSVEASEIFCRQGHADYMARTNLPMLLFLKKGNVYVGSSGMHSLDWPLRKFEVGYWCRTRFHNQGLATEAVAAIVELALTGLKARRLTCLPDAENLPSRRVAERAGFVLEGIMRRDRATPEGELRDTCLYAIAR